MTKFAPRNRVIEQSTRSSSSRLEQVFQPHTIQRSLLSGSSSMATRWHPPRIPRRHSVAPRRHFHLSRAVLEPIFRSRWYSLEASTSEVPNEGLTSLGFLMKGGFVRKSASGVYTVMPNGRRVLDKIERIVREEMRSVGATPPSLL